MPEDGVPYPLLATTWLSHPDPLALRTVHLELISITTTGVQNTCAIHISVQLGMIRASHTRGESNPSIHVEGMDGKL